MNEGIAKRDVPRTQRMNLAVQVLAALREPGFAIRHAAERRKRLRRPPDACRAGNERPDTFDVHAPRGSLGESLSKGVV